MADVTYVKKFDDGKVRERVVSTPAAQVQLEFDGWTRKADDAPAKATPAGDTKSTK